MYTASEMLFKSLEFVVKLGKEGRKIEYKVTIQYATQPNLYHLKQLINCQRRDTLYDAIQALDIVLSHLLSIM